MNYGLKLKTRIFGETLSAHEPDAQVILTGSEDFPAVCGAIQFFQVTMGIVMVAEVRNLPNDSEIDACSIYQLRLAEPQETDCNSYPMMPTIKQSSGKQRIQKPDFPMLSGRNGYLWNAFYHDQLYLRDLIGRQIFMYQDAQRKDFTKNSLISHILARGIIHKF